ncbi:MAG: molybdopterin-dependent oxidoreductase [Nitrospirae bacterium]|nr:molybdopterin-dependent oxidoreductase [Nitrospirota bacterium]
MIELTIDDTKVKVAKGSTILEAALENGIYIPHLCWDPRLKPYGGCRMCLVEVEGQTKLLASCSNPAGNGMVVHTNTPKLNKVRKTMLELLLVHHPLDCPVCDKAGMCKLQDLAQRYGPTKSRFSEEKFTIAKDTGSPFIERNPNRCILCGKCVTICWDHQGVGAINFIGRGFNTKVSPAFEEILDCEFCGQCVDVCPVGALGSKPFKYSASAWFLESQDNICPYCSVGCTVTLDMREGKIIRTRGESFKGVNKGDLCVKGRYGMDFIYSERRLKKPLIRKHGELTETTWEEALYTLAQRLEHIIETKGPDRIGAIGSGRFTTEGNFMLQHFMRNIIGTNNIDSSARFGFAKVQEAAYRAFGLKNLPINLYSPIGKGAILIIESDITSTHPIWGLRFLDAKKKGAKLLSIEPRETKLSRHSDSWLRIRPGTSQVILNGIMHIAIEEGYHLKNEMSTKAANFSEMVELTRQFTPELVSDMARIDKEEFLEMAHIFLSAESRLIAMTLGSVENNKGLNTALSAANLAILMGDGPAALNMPADYANTFGMWKIGVTPDYLPGYVKIEDNPGKNLFQMLYEKNTIDALYIIGDDPLTTYPDFIKVSAALRGLDLLVVQDIQLTETARMAHIVLPASSWGEKEGSFINAAGMVQRIKKSVSPTGDSLPGWQILRNLARFMKAPIKAENIAALRNEVSEIKVERGKEKWSYTPVPFEESERTSRQYPLIMVTGNLMQHSGALSVMSQNLTEVFSDAFIQVNEKDATRYGITDSSQVRIESRRGSTRVLAKVTDEVTEGMIFAPIHFSNARLNELTYAHDGGAAPLVAVSIKPEKENI